MENKFVWVSAGFLLDLCTEGLTSEKRLRPRPTSCDTETIFDDLSQHRGLKAPLRQQSSVGFYPEEGTGSSREAGVHLLITDRWLASALLEAESTHYTQQEEEGWARAGSGSLSNMSSLLMHPAKAAFLQLHLKVDDTLWAGCKWLSCKASWD